MSSLFQLLAFKHNLFVTFVFGENTNVKLKAATCLEEIEGD